MITMCIDMRLIIENINGNTATAKVKIDRTKYNVRYGSDTFFDNLGNRVIYNEFDLNVKLTF